MQQVEGFFFVARCVGMVMHAMWMINDRKERDICTCQKERVASSGHLVMTHAKPLLQAAPHGRARMAGTS